MIYRVNRAPPDQLTKIKVYFVNFDVESYSRNSERKKEMQRISNDYYYYLLLRFYQVCFFIFHQHYDTDFLSDTYACGRYTSIFKKGLVHTVRL